MELSQLRQRLQTDRARTPVTITLPDDVIEELKQVAAELEIADYKALIRAYIGQGLRAHLIEKD